MEPGDEALVDACRRGDADAWELLSARYLPLVFSICRHAGLDHEQAADACQNVFTVLTQRLDTLEQPARLRAWLVTTARRQAAALREHERGGASLAYDDLVSQADMQRAGELLPDERIVQLEDQLKIRAALATLDTRCRELLSLLFYRPDPAPYAEIVAAMGIPEGSIGPTRARCLEKMRRKLEEMHF